MERELANVDNWNPTSLVERRNRLIDWALERWRVEVEGLEFVQVVPADQDDASFEDAVEEAAYTTET